MWQIAWRTRSNKLTTVFVCAVLDLLLTRKRLEISSVHSSISSGRITLVAFIVEQCTE